MSVIDHVQALGFDVVGIAPVRPVPDREAYRSWLRRGYHGEMGYLARSDRVERRVDPSRILPGVRSVICVGLNYYPGPRPGDWEDSGRGLISNYAWGEDYHAVMLPRLERLADVLEGQVGAAGHPLRSRAYVDTGPVLERAYAARAGLGFIGKNTCLIHPRMGSWLFLGVILVDAALDGGTGQVWEDVSCGTCRRCLEACPTGALVAPYLMDARRCISYLTIELKGAIPRQLRPLMGRWIYGCDVCQTVCPWQRFARPTGEGAFRAVEPDRASPRLLDVLRMREGAFRRRYEGTPLFRTGWNRLRRNAAVAAGNWGDERAVPALVELLLDVEAGPLVRGHVAWALGQIGGDEAYRGLRRGLRREMDAFVRREIQMAIRK